MFAILFLFLMSSQINCHSICETIKPNGAFNGLHINRKYGVTKGDTCLVMNNRKGTEWMFDIALDEHSLKMNDSMATTDVSALYKFSLFSIFGVYHHENCMVFATNASYLEVKCEKWWGIPLQMALPVADYLVLSKNNYLPGEYSHNFIMFFNRKVRSELLVYSVYSFTEEIDSQTELIDCKQSKSGPFCEIPPFIEQMDDTLFSQLEGAVDFKSNEEKERYLLLFQIDGRPQFCTTFMEELSSECKSSAKMTALLPECFETSNSILFWVLIVVALLVVVIIIGFVVLFVRRRKSQHSVTSTAKPKSMSTQKQTFSQNFG